MGKAMPMNGKGCWGAGQAEIELFQKSGLRCKAFGRQPGDDIGQDKSGPGDIGPADRH